MFIKNTWIISGAIKTDVHFFFYECYCKSWIKRLVMANVWHKLTGAGYCVRYTQNIYFMACYFILTYLFPIHKALHFSISMHVFSVVFYHLKNVCISDRQRTLHFSCFLLNHDADFFGFRQNGYNENILNLNWILTVILANNMYIFWTIFTYFEQYEYYVLTTKTLLNMSAKHQLNFLYFICFLSENVSKQNSLNVLMRKEMFYLTTHSTHFIYCYMASDIW